MTHDLVVAIFSTSTAYNLANWVHQPEYWRLNTWLASCQTKFKWKSSCSRNWPRAWTTARLIRSHTALLVSLRCRTICKLTPWHVEHIYVFGDQQWSETRSHWKTFSYFSVQMLIVRSDRKWFYAEIVRHQNHFVLVLLYTSAILPKVNSYLFTFFIANSTFFTLLLHLTTPSYFTNNIFQGECPNSYLSLMEFLQNRK